MDWADGQDLTLLLAGDAAETEMWADEWVRSYPGSRLLKCAAADGAAVWQQQLAQAWVQTGSGKVVLVGFGAGALACAAWYYQADFSVQKRLAAVILVSPLQADFDAAAAEGQAWCVCRFQGKTALVVGQGDALCPVDWAEGLAQRWQARLLHAPYRGHLNGALGGFAWGMRLMQEMLW